MRRDASSARHARTQQGAAAVEFALIFPLLVIICFGIIAFGMVFAQSLSLGNTARQAARSGVIETTTCTQVVDLAKDAADTIGMDGANVTVHVKRGMSEPAPADTDFCTAANATKQPCEGQPLGTNVYVTLGYTSKLIIPLGIVKDQYDLTGKGVFRCEFS